MSSDNKDVWYWLKAIVLFVGRSILFVLGLLFLTGFIVRQFEGNFSFWEISMVEVIFLFALLSVSIRHYRIGRVNGLKASTIIYRPIQNFGWVLFIIFALLGGQSIVTNNQRFLQGLYKELMLIPFSNLVVEVIIMALVFFCIYWASPKVKGNDEPVESKMEAAE